LAARQPTTQPPVLLLRKTDVLLSTNAAHAGEIAQLSPAGHEDKATQLILDKKGNGLIHLTRSNSATFVRGGTYLVEAKNLRVLVRLL
jgi:hypothetical protein